MAEGNQFGFVVAAVKIRQAGFKSGITPGGLEDQAETDAPGIGQGRSIHPEVPAALVAQTAAFNRFSTSSAGRGRLNR